MSPRFLRALLSGATAVVLPFALHGVIPTPASPAEQAAWREHGRTLPAPELLQPTIDAASPTYQPRKDVALSGTFKGAASDVLADLSRRWIEAFQKYYPNV